MDKKTKAVVDEAKKVSETSEVKMTQPGSTSKDKDATPGTIKTTEPHDEKEMGPRTLTKDNIDEVREIPDIEEMSERAMDETVDPTPPHASKDVPNVSKDVATEVTSSTIASDTLPKAAAPIDNRKVAIEMEHSEHPQSIPRHERIVDVSAPPSPDRRTESQKAADKVKRNKYTVLNGPIAPLGNGAKAVKMHGDRARKYVTGEVVELTSAEAKYYKTLGRLGPYIPEDDEDE
jgi:hypothetical protein